MRQGRPRRSVSSSSSCSRIALRESCANPSAIRGSACKPLIWTNLSLQRAAALFSKGSEELLYLRGAANDQGVGHAIAGVADYILQLERRTIQPDFDHPRRPGKRETRRKIPQIRGRTEHRIRASQGQAAQLIERRSQAAQLELRQLGVRDL